MCSINHLMQTEGCSENNVHSCCVPQELVMKGNRGLFTKNMPVTPPQEPFSHHSITRKPNLSIKLATFIVKTLNYTYSFSCSPASLSSHWRKATVRLSAEDPVADGGLAVNEGIQCQEPVVLTLDRHNRLVSTLRCTAESCVSTLEIHVWSTNQCEDFGSKTG